MNSKLRNFYSLPLVARKYCYVSFLSALFFSWPVVYGWASEVLSPIQIGLYFAIANVAGLVLEIPTGAVADFFGRKKSSAFGLFLWATNPLLIFFGHSFPYYVAAAILGFGGSTLVSGALEAFIYDHKEVSKELYSKIVSYRILFFQFGLLFATFFGGFLFEFHHSLAFIFESLAFIFAAFVVLSIRDAEPHVKIKTQFFKTALLGIKHIFSSKRLISIVILYALMQSLMVVCIEFLNEGLMIFHKYSPASRGLMISGSKAIVLIVLSALVFKLVSSNIAKINYLMILFGTVLIGYNINNRYSFLIFFLLFNFISSTNSAFFSPIINAELEEKHRATSLSSLSAITNLTQLCFAIMAGLIIDQFGILVLFKLFLLIYILAIIPAYVFYRSTHRQ